MTKRFCASKCIVTKRTITSKITLLTLQNHFNLSTWLKGKGPPKHNTVMTSFCHQNDRTAKQPWSPYIKMDLYKYIYTPKEWLQVRN